MLEIYHNVMTKTIVVYAWRRRGRGGGAAAEPTRHGGIIVPDPHTANAIAALCGTQPLHHYLSGS
ncbi:hypothetical protein E2C01_090620 [Portunus trituberculatus]|uniref:Uncharacterized protein n=1 Tax=Portunus trituberculatus TaxID=210409 RepID=A0A5B7JF71_PORTR|nr:hypothetical protein [Portunus trituberculatus]